jgi:hypothetical protein
MTTKLENGCIPIGVPCPWKEKCAMADSCFHEGLKHTTPFSCAAARGFDLVEEMKANRISQTTVKKS